MLEVLGKLPKGERLKRIQSSQNYRDGAFQNQTPTTMVPPGVSYFTMLKGFINKSKQSAPKEQIPTGSANLQQLSSQQPTLVWFGHSSYLLNLDGKKILVDPVLGGHASPFSFMIPAFKGTDPYGVEDFPEIDILLLTHDHYDHLDHGVIKQLRPKVRQVLCSLGVGEHLEYWGYDKKRITELDWFETAEWEGLKFTAAPARHFSGRSTKRNQSIWSSFILQTKTKKIYMGGDSGYDAHFKQLGETYGPFDLALLECGQYNTLWPLIHMMPEQTVQAAMDLKTNVLMPVHWAKFALAYHSWKEPIERLTKAAKEKGQAIATPMIGEEYIIGTELRKEWWLQLV